MTTDSGCTSLAGRDSTFKYNHCFELKAKWFSLSSLVSILHSSNILFAHRVQFSISAFKAIASETGCQTVTLLKKKKKVTSQRSHIQTEPKWSCFMLHLKTTTPLSSTTFHLESSWRHDGQFDPVRPEWSRQRAKTHTCPGDPVGRTSCLQRLCWIYKRARTGSDIIVTGILECDNAVGYLATLQENTIVAFSSTYC